jgi:hypothetical protein
LTSAHLVSVPQGVISQITPVNPSTLAVADDGDSGGGGPRSYPPTLFVHMAQRDPEKAETVTAALAILKCVVTPLLARLLACCLGRLDSSGKACCCAHLANQGGSAAPLLLLQEGGHACS